MKKLPWYDKFLFFLNTLFGTALLFSYLLPYIPPKTFALLSVLSLAVPLLIIINFLFFFYWLIKFKREMLLSLIILLIGFNHITSIYEFNSANITYDEEGDVSILSYNAKQFNQFGWDEEEDIPEKIDRYLKEQDPDIIAIQEYFKGELEVAKRFPYKYINLKTKSAEFGLAILSKYPIIDSASLDFETISNNNAIYADILIKGDTVRVFNVHLQSFGLKPDMKNIEQEQSKKVFLGMGQTFVRQQEQMELIRKVKNESNYKTIIMGDLNNTAYSYIYRELLSEGLNDAYKLAGNGWGRTFDFSYFPLRIDYILVDDKIVVTSYDTDLIRYSDHFPLKVTIKLQEKTNP